MVSSRNSGCKPSICEVKLNSSLVAIVEQIELKYKSKVVSLSLKNLNFSDLDRVKAMGIQLKAGSEDLAVLKSAKTVRLQEISSVTSK